MDEMPPSPEATYERARRLANIAVWTVALQHRRLRTKEPEDDEFLSRRWADFQFLIMALTRCRRAATLAAQVAAINTTMQSALQEFDHALPMLKSMRDVAEHFDDYALDRGRSHTICRQNLEVMIVGEKTFQWLQYSLDADAALAAAQHLFSSIKGAADQFGSAL